MTGLKFAIVQAISGQEESLIIERNQEQIVEWLRLRVRDKLHQANAQGVGYEMGQVMTAIDQAFGQIVDDFKRETVKLYTVSQQTKD
jgi:hypothetical protein